VSSLETTRYFRKWVGIALLIGIVAGLGALVVSTAIHYAILLFLGMGVGYLPPDTASEGTIGILPIGRPWALPLITAFGGFLSGLIVLSFAPDAEGHGADGMDSAIGSIHSHQGRMRSRVPVVNVIASALTIGSGGSAGREGPTAQLSAGFGSILADVLHLNDDDRRTAVVVGIGAGIGAIFRAPLGGAVLGPRFSTSKILRSRHLSPRSSLRSSATPSTGRSPALLRSSVI
jgi:CIC family chloride channel protein